MKYLTIEEYGLMIGQKEFTGEVPHEKQSNTNYIYMCHASRAFSIIRTATRGRIDKMSSVPEEVKNLCCELINYLHKNDFSEAKVSSRSQNTGGVNESESYAVKTLADCEKEIEQLIFDYLGFIFDDNGIPLLYRGCRA